jgi:hypothetical protein
LARPDLPDDVRELAPRARSAAHAVAAYLHDPHHGASDRRHLVLDRRSLREDTEASSDPVARLAVEAERRLVLLRAVHEAAAERGRLVEDLHRTAAERLAVIEQLDAELRTVRVTADNSDHNRLVEELHLAATERGRLVEELHRTAAERLAVIETLDAELRTLRVTAEPNDG